MTAALVMLTLAATPGQVDREVTAAEKKSFLELLARLKAHGEFYPDEEVEKVVPHTRVLLAFTTKDLENRDLYPFLVLSRGLLDRKEQQEYGVKHFGKIAHPRIKLAWGIMLFDEKVASPEIVIFLRAAMENKEQSKFMSESLGPTFEDFKKRVLAYKVDGK